jgi:hypothetical protein
MNQGRAPAGSVRKRPEEADGRVREVAPLSRGLLPYEDRARILARNPA